MIRGFPSLFANIHIISGIAMQNRQFNVSIHISFLLTVKLGMKGATGYDRAQPLQREDWIIGIAIRLQSYFARDE
ncbi:MAG TPA: hypothetical protein DIS88_09595 [Prevotella sp.]|nr:hypothetical protein [Prevotella sp.]